MSVLRLNFHYGTRAESVVLPDTHRVVKRLKDGSEVVEYKDVDYVKLIQQNGTVDLWSIRSMIDAGVDLSRFKLHTQNPTRLETALSAESMIKDFESSGGFDLVDTSDPVDTLDPVDTADPVE